MDAYTLKTKPNQNTKQKKTTRVGGNQTTSTDLVVTFPDWIKQINN